MTKKDYSKIAEVFKITKPMTSVNYDVFERATAAQWRIMVRRMCWQLKMDNPRFDEDTFCDAVGLEKDTLPPWWEDR